ncbi:MAG: hypothetical protein VX223_15790 [Myxococcota bacterium]|nr:hypothetical protein [Myxococcota bacterium]
MSEATTTATTAFSALLLAKSVPSGSDSAPVSGIVLKMSNYSPGLRKMHQWHQSAPYTLGFFLMLSGAAVGCEEEAPVATQSADTSQEVYDLPDGMTAEVETLGWLKVVDNYEWLPTPSDSDPFYATNSGKADVCTPDDYGVEELVDGPWFDITTSLCGYMTVDQPTRVAITEGDTLRLRIWHFQIIAGAGPYHLELAVKSSDGTLMTLWSADVNVPTSSQLFYEEWPAPTDIELGSTVYWHVSNHGINTWGFIELLTAPQP